MVQRIAVAFGTTEEELRKLILKACENNGWDQARVRYVVDINACTVKETVYAVADSALELPMHPSGSEAVQRLIP